MNAYRKPVKPRFFGQFLLERGVITPQQLADALKYQQSRILKIGELAVREGYLTPHQVDEINAEQRKTDKLFGEIAVEKGFLTQEQLERLITLQRKNHIFLGEILVEKGYIPGSKLAEYLEEYHRIQRPIENLRNVIPKNHRYFDEILIILDMTTKLFRRVPNIPIKFGTGYYLFRMENPFLFLRIKFTGKYEFEYIIGLSEKFAREVVQKIYRDETVEYTHDLIADFLREFTGVLGNNIASQLAELGQGTQMEFAGVAFSAESPEYTASEGFGILTFPARAPASEFTVGIVESLTPENQPGNSPGKMRVLIADDSALARIQIREVLENMDEIEVVGTAKDGDEVEELVQTLHPDLVFIDLIMPGKSPKEILNLLAEEEIGAVVVSAMGELPTWVNPKLRRIIKATLSKPINQDKVKETVETLLGENSGTN